MKNLGAVGLVLGLGIGIAAQGPAPAFGPQGEAVVRELGAGEFARVEARFDQAMAAALPLDKLTAVWRRTIEQEGAFQSAGAATVVAGQGHHVARVPCVFARGKLETQVSFDDAGRIAGLFFRVEADGDQGWTAADYVNPASFHEISLTIADGKWKLPATLTVPNGAGPFPGLILISGSGPNDENETIGPNQPFKDLAWGLASQGVAVLRYPKRTKVYGAASMVDRDHFTVAQEYTNDAAAAIKLMAAQAGVDPHRIFVLGHSEGGYLAPRIAQENPGLAGIVILAGNLDPVPSLVVEQIRYLAPLEGADAAATARLVAQAEAAEKQVESPDLKPGMTVTIAGAAMPASYWLDLRGYRPGAVAAGLGIPILVLQGGRDYQVRESEFEAWKKALAADRGATFHLYPTLTHLFMPTYPANEVLSTPSDYQHAGHVAAAVVGDIAAWVKTRPGTRE